MKRVTDATKKIILAGLGSIDEQNEEIKDLLRRGSSILGMGAVDNEELLYNGNREEIMKRRKEKEREDNTFELGHGRSLYYNAVKDEDGNTVERNIEYERKPDTDSKEIRFEAEEFDDKGKKISFYSKKESNVETGKEGEIEGGAEND